MTDVAAAQKQGMAGVAETDYEVVVLGAGVAGLYQVKQLVDLGVRATVLDANADLGGTWYMNRYPGARFDSESYTYGYSWSRELLDEWHWTERFSPNPKLSATSISSPTSSDSATTSVSTPESKPSPSMTNATAGPFASPTAPS